KYACLSHCWGPQGSPLQLNRGTVQTLRAGIARERLPKTFRDATDICCKLGISYLWIDALCILQDDLEDWKDAAATMADIYEHAFITIGATWSNDSNGGCFSRTRDQFKHHMLGDTGLYVRETPPPFPFNGSFQRKEWPLLTRGWVFQERVLSPRVIHYAKDQILWECGAALLTECGTRDRSVSDSVNPWDPLKFRRDDSRTSWRHLVESYSRLLLTKSDDRLPALAGLVERQMERRQEDIYVAGMWKKSILDDLAFYGHNEELKDYTVPTWSWAFFRSKLTFEAYERHTALSLKDLTFTRMSPPHVGRVIDASITLKGPVIVGKVVDNDWLNMV
ncbi:HET-domain-containing protein, partial [Ophiobolus disseminans]